MMSPQQYEVVVRHDVRVPTATPGVTLSADLFLPRAGGPTPVVVCLLPYRKDALGGVGVRAAMHEFAAAGIACVLADPLGLGSSDGVARPPFDPAEADDGADLVRWAAGQPWSTGAVGMWGYSYGALLALRTASRRPPGLRAVVSVLGMLDPERDFVHPGGAPGCFTALASWGLTTLHNLVLPPLGDFHAADEQRRWRRRVATAEPYLTDLYRHPAGDPRWRDRVVDATAITVPVLCVAGWRDMFCDGSLRTFERLGGARKLLVGPWSHTIPDEAVPVAVRWWRRWLAGEANGVDTEPPVTLHVPGTDLPGAGWRDFDTWPPEGVPQEVMPVAAGAGAAAAPDATVGVLSGTWGIPAGDAGRVLDQHDDDTRAVTVTGEPVREPLLLLGRPVVTLDLTWSAVRRVVVKLTDVDPAGRSVLITGGILADVPADRSALRVTLDPACHELPPGHALRVVVSESTFPRLWPARDGGTLRVGRVGLTVPVAPAGAGKPVSVPAPARPGAGTPWLAHRPLWEITREPARDRVTVMLGDETSAVLPSGGVRVDAANRVSAGTDREASAVTRVEGTADTTAVLSTGERVRTTVRLRLTPEAGSADARVTVDGAEVLRHRWDF
ncbi:CocE/NonD family hydrolase [Dactylosporangium fulvum]|uniref:CocE/NonD family hydrolase n=1 Tax=Dactylosporangium fulvum TaxID=53359 RepID=A0ABY5W7A6_9ACTN|nr:CocE/NonD family hydrolase [Dactylosporangium fulvum]UWP85245.1 CocE/NonD family hydrolase [Dactylosporangium fulvum]